MIRPGFFLVFVAFLGAVCPIVQAAPNGADLARIAYLKKNTIEIAEALRTPNTEVAKYFLGVLEDPARMQKVLGTSTEPEPFRHYVLDELKRILETRKLPKEDQTQESFLLALFAAFRDQNSKSTVRPRAYRMWAYEIYPKLLDAEKTAAKTALTQRATHRDQRVDAVPALLLVLDHNLVARALATRVKVDSDPAVRRRAMEAMHKTIGRTSELGRNEAVQLAAAEFLRDTDDLVREHTLPFLVDTSEMKDRARNLLAPAVVTALLKIGEDDQVVLKGRVAAIDAVGYNLFVDFYSYTIALQLRPTYEALVRLMASPTKPIRQAAARALARMKPFDEDAMVGLVIAAFGTDQHTSDIAFNALGATTANLNEQRIERLPGDGPKTVRQAVIAQMRRILANPRLDPTGSRRRHGAELLRRNYPVDGDTLAQLASLYRAFPAATNADVYARDTLLSALLSGKSGEITYKSLEDPAGALNQFLDAVTDAPAKDKAQLERLARDLRPSPEAFVGALATSSGARRLLLLNQMASYKTGSRIQEITKVDGGDAALADCFEDPSHARIVLSALARHHRAVNLRNAPLLLNRVLAAAETIDRRAPTPQAAMHLQAAQILSAIGTVNGRHLAFGNGADARDLRRRVLQLADNTRAPAASQAAAKEVREKLQKRPGGVARCAADLADEAESADDEAGE